METASDGQPLNDDFNFHTCPPSLPPASLYSPDYDMTHNRDLTKLPPSKSSTANQNKLLPASSYPVLAHVLPSPVQSIGFQGIDRPNQKSIESLNSYSSNKTNFHSFLKPKLSNLISTLPKAFRVVIVRPASSCSVDQVDDLFTKHKSRSLALKSSLFAIAGIVEIRLNKQRQCIALVIEDFSKLPPLDSITVMGNWPITCSLPLKERSISGIIRRVPLDLEDSEILCELKSDYPHIMSVQRLTRRDKDSNMPIKTGSIKIEFDASKDSPLPDRIILFFEVFPCELFVRNPMRCTKCQSFGHTTSFCRSPRQTCAKCSQNHSTDSCLSLSECCPNCKGDHPAYSKNCPKYSFARNVEVISASHRISYSEAIKRINPVNSMEPPVNQPTSLTSPTVVIPQPQSTALNQTHHSTTQCQQSISDSQTQLKSIDPTHHCTKSNPSTSFGSHSTITLIEICPPAKLNKFILDIQKLFQRKLKDQPTQSAILLLVKNFLDCTQTIVNHPISSSTKSLNIHPSPKRKKNKINGS